VKPDAFLGSGAVSGSPVTHSQADELNLFFNRSLDSSLISLAFLRYALTEIMLCLGIEGKVHVRSRDQTWSTR
jgi:hypothetical protein